MERAVYINHQVTVDGLLRHVGCAVGVSVDNNGWLLCELRFVESLHCNLDAVLWHLPHEQLVVLVLAKLSRPRARRSDNN